MARTLFTSAESELTADQHCLANRRQADSRESSSVGPYERSVLGFRADARMRAFVEKNYLDEDLAQAVWRYGQSAEFSRICSILAPGLSADSRLLDLGVGRGLTSLAFAQKGARVTSVEFDPSEIVGIGALSRHLKLQKAPLSVVRGDVLRLPFGDGCFDVAFCRSLLHHLTDLGQGLREIFRVLRPGGLFMASNEHIVSVFSNGEAFLKAHPAVAYGVDERAYPAYRYWWTLRRAGFQRVRFFSYPLDFAEFLEVTKRNPVRARLVRLPLIGGGLSRFLHAVHVGTRAFIFVPERGLPAISIVSEKICPQEN